MGFQGSPDLDFENPVEVVARSKFRAPPIGSESKKVPPTPVGPLGSENLSNLISEGHTQIIYYVENVTSPCITSISKRSNSITFWRWNFRKNYEICIFYITIACNFALFAKFLPRKFLPKSLPKTEFPWVPYQVLKFFSKGWQRFLQNWVSWGEALFLYKKFTDTKVAKRNLPFNKTDYFETEGKLLYYLEKFSFHKCR